MSDEDTKDSGSVYVEVLKSASNGNVLFERLNSNDLDDARGYVVPPIDLKALAGLFELSGVLRPNVETYMTNVEAQGHRFSPAFDLLAQDADERVADSILVERLTAATASKLNVDAIMPPTKQEVETKLTELKRSARIELAVLRAFFASCTTDGTFTDLRVQTRQDLEVLGVAYWEVLRGVDGRPRTLIRIDPVSMRLGSEVHEVSVKIQRRTSDTTWETVNVARPFRRFCQVDTLTSPLVWFKQLGDPRVVSRETGKVYQTEAAMRTKEPNAHLATEVMYWSIPSLSSPYGLPRWIGNLPGVLGSRNLDEVNLDYFDNNAIPALALLVAGGRLAKGTAERLKEFFEESVRGKRSHHKLVTLEAVGAKSASMTGPQIVPKLEFVPLRSSQKDDATFQAYDDRNKRKVGYSFRMPSSFAEGKITPVDLRLAEEQVFNPLRISFDSKINKFLLPELGVRFWEFESNSIAPRDPETLGKLALDHGVAGFLLPTEVRRVLERVFNTVLPPIRHKWAGIPLPFTMGAFRFKAGPAEAVREQGRQSGDPAPVEQLLGELGLGSKPEQDDDLDYSGSMNGALEALSIIQPLGTQGSPDD